MPAYADRVKDTSTTTGTGDFTLSGTPPTGGFVSFDAAFGTDNPFEYAIELQSASEWETGIGYLSASTTLVRSEVKASSNSGAAVNFGSGTKTVFAGFNATGANANATGRDYAITRGFFIT